MVHTRAVIRRRELKCPEVVFEIKITINNHVTIEIVEIENL